MFKIGEFSKLSRISIRMLRHYDEIGLLVCQYFQRFGLDRTRLEAVMVASVVPQVMYTLTSAIVKYFGKKPILIDDDVSPGIQYEGEDHLGADRAAQRAAVEASIQEALDRLRLLDTTIERLRKDEKQMNYDVTIKTLPERQVASVRQILPCYDREGDLWHIFVRETALLHIQDGDPALCISVYHDGEYKEADVDVEIQKTVKGTYPDTEHVKFKTIPPVTVASATFQGPYRQIGEVNQAVASWVEDNGYAFDGLFFNIYHVSPHETRNPEEFVTEVCYPVRKR